jgi:hypothetical protein
MKHFGFFLILGIVLLSLQVVWGKFIPFPPARPDFTLAFTLYLGFTSSSFIGGSLAFALGPVRFFSTGFNSIVADSTSMGSSFSPFSVGSQPFWKDVSSFF